MPMKHRPPRMKVMRKQINSATNYRQAVEVANQMQGLGFRTVIEGGTFVEDSGKILHYIVHSWQKPEQRREAV